MVEEGRTLVGRAATLSAAKDPKDKGADKGSRTDIRHTLQLNGLNLQPEHAIVSRTGDVVSLQSLGNAQVCMFV